MFDCKEKLDASHPLAPMSDQDKISPYNINTISSRQVMRIKKNIQEDPRPNSPN